MSLDSKHVRLTFNVMKIEVFPKICIYWVYTAKFMIFKVFFENFQIFAHFLSIFSQFSILLLNFFPFLSVVAVSWQKNLHFKPKLRFLAQKLTNLEPFSRFWEKSDVFRQKKIFSSSFDFFQLFYYQNEGKQLIFQFLAFFSFKMEKKENFWYFQTFKVLEE